MTKYLVRIFENSQHSAGIRPTNPKWFVGYLAGSDSRPKLCAGY